MARDTYKYHFKMGNKIVHTGSLTIWIGDSLTDTDEMR